VYVGVSRCANVGCIWGSVPLSWHPADLLLLMLLALSLPLLLLLLLPPGVCGTGGPPGLCG
jgi:hypothetical protein